MKIKASTPIGNKLLKTKKNRKDNIKIKQPKINLNCDNISELRFQSTIAAKMQQKQNSTIYENF